MNSSTTKPSKQLYLVRSSQLSPNHRSIGSHAPNTGVGAKQNYATPKDPGRAQGGTREERPRGGEAWGRTAQGRPRTGRVRA